MDSFFEYKPLDSQTRSFRLLRLLRHRSVGIECEIFHAPLQDSHDINPYEALSYTWGDSELVECISVNQKSHWVTDNLHTALRNLRLPNTDRILWIDAICINQADKEEQGHQVAQMGNIYSYASRVIYWLGKATFEATLLMKSLAHLQKASMLHEDYANWSVEDPRWRKLWSNMQHADWVARHHAAGLQILLRRPWFRRIWILQEVANARAAIVCTGAHFVPSNIFVLAPLLVNMTPEPHCQSILEIMPGPHRNQTASWWNQKRDLYTLLTKFESSKATDIRDMVYALLGISSEPHDRVISIDYTKHPQEVIQHAIRYLITRDDASVHKILDLLISTFPAVDALYLVWREEQEHVTEVLNPSSRHGRVVNSGQPTNLRLGEVGVTRDPSSLFLEYRRDELLDRVETAYAETKQLMLKRAASDTVAGASETKEYGYSTVPSWEELERPMGLGGPGFEKGLRVVSWGGFEQNVKVLIVVNAKLAILGAIVDDRPCIMELLLAKSAAFDPSGSLYDVALQAASCEGRERLVRLLLDGGANVNAQGVRINLEPGQYTNALYEASRGGHDKIVKLLLDHGANVNVQGGYYGNALQAASFRGHVYVSQLLLENGAQVKVINGHFSTALLAASKEGHWKIVQLLLAKGAEVNIEHRIYGSALYAASAGGFSEIVQALLNHGANVNAQGGMHKYPLHAAVIEGHIKVVRQLLKSGAVFSGKSENWQNHLTAALQKGNREIANILIEHGVAQGVDGK